jgi:hypothetical protein
MTVGGLKPAVAPGGESSEGTLLQTLSNAPNRKKLTSILTEPPCGSVTDVSRVVTVNVDAVTKLLMDDPASPAAWFAYTPDRKGTSRIVVRIC